jgi:glycosyltransferase involved in cell wall biosynthesis
MTTLSLVIPAYNEEARLPALLDALDGSADAAVAAAGFELLEVLIVDDGSGDRTRALLEGSRLPKLRPILDGRVNRGKGAATADGVRAARGEYVLLVDVDLSTPLEELGKLAAAVRDGADVAIGSRAVPGAVVERGPALRKITGTVFASTVRLLTGLDVRDTQNGFKLMPTAVGRGLFSEQLCPGFAFDVELLVRAKLARLRIAEVPVLYVHDSRSRVRVASASVRMLRDVISLSYRLRPRSQARARPSSRQARLGDLPADEAD